MATKYGTEAFIEWARIKGTSDGIKKALLVIVVVGIAYMVLNEYEFVGTLD